MFNIGMPELLVVFLVILIVFGPRRLPEIGRTIGKAFSAFKKAASDLKDTLEQEPPEEIKEEKEGKLEKTKERDINQP